MSSATPPAPRGAFIHGPEARLLAPALLLLAACTSSSRARPVPYSATPTAPPDEATIQRFARSDDKPGRPAVAVLGSADKDRDAAAGNKAQLEAPVPPGGLTFDEVMESVEEQFPMILAAMEEVEIARAQYLSAEGGFDVNVKADAFVGAQGFYENESASVFIEQPTTAWGATVFGGYKRGTGDFPIWENGIKTREDGEFSAGVRVPLLKGREIDGRRLDLWRARIGEAQADPIVLQKRLEATQKAALSYWKWVASGQKLSIARRLLALATDRNAGVVRSVELGQLPEISIVENQRLIVERQSIVIRAERALQEAAIALSLFWRGPTGAPTVPGEEALPASLPSPITPELLIQDTDFATAVSHRPEVRSVELEANRLNLDLQKAENDLLPKLDLSAAASQDVGDRVSTPDDKGPFEFDVFVNFDVPVQRRAAKGRVRSLEGKASQLRRKLQFARESVVAEVQDGQSAIRQTWLRLAQVRENAELAAQLEAAERVYLQEGESDLFRVNLREQQTASAASMLIDVIAEHFRAVADYRASLGIPYDEVLTR